MSQGTAKIPMTFQIFKGEELLRTEKLAQDIIKVGKLPSSHLRIDDDNVSRMHAVIEVTGPDEIYIIDLGSASGTIVNGKKVNKTKLQNGDEIVLGGTRVVVEIGAVGAGDDESTLVADKKEIAAAVAAAPAAPAAPSAPKPAAPPPVAAAVPAASSSPFGAPLANPFAAAPQLSNPFAPAPVAAAAVESSEPQNPEDVRYGIVASGPAVRPDEVETTQQGIEVVVMWGDNSVLSVSDLAPARAFYVGEGGGKGAPQADYLIGADVLGTDRLPVVVAAGGGFAVVVPSGAEGDLTVNDLTRQFSELGSELQPSNELPGARQILLVPGATVKVKYKGFVFLVKPIAAGKRVGVGGPPQIGWKEQIWTLASLAVHGSFLIMMYFMPPSPSSLSLDLLTADSRLAKYLIQPPETAPEEPPEFLQQPNQDDDSGGKGKRHKDEEGAMGKQESKKTKNRFGIQGPADNADPHMARTEAQEQARNAGVLGVLRSMTGSWNSPTSPYGADTALGNDPMSAMGALMGDQIGENFGFGGLGLRGTGRGGGGTGEGTIGLGNVGTIGHGGGGGDGNGYGRGAGNLGGRSARVPRIQAGNADVRGSLSKEVIRRVIQRHINEVRFCYEQELNQRPDLGGRVTVSFIISPTGAVSSAAVTNSDMGAPRVESCIAEAVRRWSFPAPEGGGMVAVNYPFVLQMTGGE